MALITCFYISCRPMCLFEIWVLVLCPRGVSPSLITTLPSDGQCSSTWWLSDCRLRNTLLLVTLLRSFWHRTLAGCSLPTGTSRVVSSILAILAPSHDIFYCHDIPRYIVTMAILVSTISIKLSRVSHSTTVKSTPIFNRLHAMYVTDDVTWPQNVLWCSTVGYPSDSLASCLGNRIDSRIGMPYWPWLMDISTVYLLSINHATD